MIELKKGDCYQLIKEIPDNSIDLIITDPPYDVQCDGGKGSALCHSVSKSYKQLVNDNIYSGYDFSINEEFIRVMKNINIYIWCNKKAIPEYFDFYVHEHKCLFELITWHKHNAPPLYSNKYLTDTEYCLYFHKDSLVHPETYEDAQTFYFSPLNVADKKTWEHPTIKPLALTERMIKNSSDRGDIVLDVFMGSGTTGVACKNTGRNFIGFEISDKYFDIAQSRINIATEKRYCKKKSLFEK